MHSIKHNKGFAVFTSAVLLSLAGIIFTTKMAATQLIDNQVVANYYRNHEAFVSAESGISLVLSQINHSSTLLDSLPLTYQPAGSHYQVTIERVNKNTVVVNSSGRSKDGSAERQIQVKVYHESTYNIPASALASNGKLNINSAASINEGCEGVRAEHCKSPGNIAQYQIQSRPENEIRETQCTGAALGDNQIAQSALYSNPKDNHFLQIGELTGTDNKIENTQNWPYTQPLEATFFGHEMVHSSAPSTLFESTFGITKSAGISALQSAADVAIIDMTLASATSCSQALTDVDENISTIYIKGECTISPTETAQSMSSEDKLFAIGSVDKPKLVFIEGGTFSAPADIAISVSGMLYFLPAQYLITDQNGNELLVEEQVVDIGRVMVNGAVLSGYNCSHNADSTTGQKQKFSVRYDKTVLNTLYKNLESPELDSGYRIVDGSWRDF